MGHEGKRLWLASLQLLVGIYSTMITYLETRVLIDLCRYIISIVYLGGPAPSARAGVSHRSSSVTRVTLCYCNFVLNRHRVAVALNLELLHCIFCRAQ